MTEILVEHEIYPRDEINLRRFSTRANLAVAEVNKPYDVLIR